VALGAGTAHGPGEGFRGLWHDEWTRSGHWKEPEATDSFDLAPFGKAFYSSGSARDELTWNKPRRTRVVAFDLYFFGVRDLGNWRYRVDEGPWRNVGVLPPREGNHLWRLVVDEPVEARVQIRGYDGNAPCIAAVAGICVHSDRSAPASTSVHNLSVGTQLLTHFCRESAGDPLALLDDLRPDLIAIAFSNDVLFDAVSIFEAKLRRLVARVASFADVLLMSPYEQRPPRKVQDATTCAGSRVVTSHMAGFVPSDVTCIAAGTNIPDNPPSSITSVQSTRQVTLSAPAMGSSNDGELIIGKGREVDIQAKYRLATRRVAESMACAHLDLYAAWSAMGAKGWGAASAMDLMVDQYHASWRGHRDIARRVLKILGQVL
jgi:hypothetical protein